MNSQLTLQQENILTRLTNQLEYEVNQYNTSGAGVYATKLNYSDLEQSLTELASDANALKNYYNTLSSLYHFSKGYGDIVKDVKHTQQDEILNKLSEHLSIEVVKYNKSENKRFNRHITLSELMIILKHTSSEEVSMRGIYNMMRDMYGFDKTYDEVVGDSLLERKIMSNSHDSSISGLPFETRGINLLENDDGLDASIFKGGLTGGEFVEKPVTATPSQLDTVFSAMSVSDKMHIQLIVDLVIARKNSNMSVAELATKSGVSKKYIKKLERFEKKGNLEKLSRLADALGVRIEIVGLSLQENS